jgi:hypothetical protein
MGLVHSYLGSLLCLHTCCVMYGENFVSFQFIFRLLFMDFGFSMSEFNSLVVDNRIPKSCFQRIDHFVGWVFKSGYLQAMCQCTVWFLTNISVNRSPRFRVLCRGLIIQVPPFYKGANVSLCSLVQGLSDKTRVTLTTTPSIYEVAALNGRPFGYVSCSFVCVLFFSTSLILG